MDLETSRYRLSEAKFLLAAEGCRKNIFIKGLLTGDIQNFGI